MVPGAGLSDLSPHDAAWPSLASPLTMRLPGQEPPPELIMCQYTGSQAIQQCAKSSMVACPLHQPEDCIVCECGSRFCGFHVERIVTLGLHVLQRRAGAPPLEPH